MCPYPQDHYLSKYVHIQMAIYVRISSFWRTTTVRVPACVRMCLFWMDTICHNVSVSLWQLMCLYLYGQYICPNVFVSGWPVYVRMCPYPDGQCQYMSECVQSGWPLNVRISPYPYGNYLPYCFSILLMSECVRIRIANITPNVSVSGWPCTTWR
jgi:hypothetical protein